MKAKTSIKVVHFVLKTETNEWCAQDETHTEGPLAVLDFWLERQTNLISIMQQLESEPIKNAGEALQNCHSTYYPAFNRQVVLWPIPLYRICLKIQDEIYDQSMSVEAMSLP